MNKKGVWAHFFQFVTYCPVSNDAEAVAIQPNVNKERATELLEICFDTFCRHGLEGTSLKMLSEACGVTNAALVYYFGTKDNIVIESTAHCMARVEDDFMANAPTSFSDIARFLQEMPALTARRGSTGPNTDLCIRSMPAPNTGRRAGNSSRV